MEARSTEGLSFPAGAADIDARANLLAERMPPSLAPLGHVAYNYRWSWTADGDRVFRDISPYRWRLSGANPVHFLSTLPYAALASADRDESIRERVRALADEITADSARPTPPRPGIDGPIAFLCSEFGVHNSLPIYSGGLGILAGDILKEASDQALPLVAVGLFYRKGYFHQRLDQSGRQVEYWTTNDPDGLPMAPVTRDGVPLRLSVTIYGRETFFQVWRVDVGRVPLYLLDADVPGNDPVQRWTTSRLYEGTRAVRLAQYALLGIGGLRTLEALGINPWRVHLNEGHPSLAALELAARDVAQGLPLGEALERAAQRFVFTTHTPVPAGNETYSADELLAAFGDLPARLHLDDASFLRLFRVHQDDHGERPGLTPLALRVSRVRNGVSRLHGEVARAMWQPMFPDRSVDEVPIAHVTNGAHLPTFLSRPMRALYDAHLGEDWLHRAADPATWEPILDIPNEDLWQARQEARFTLIEEVRLKRQQDRLLRGEQIDDVRGAAAALEPAALTLGFARRLATYKRVGLLVRDPARLFQIVSAAPGAQILIAGKAHPLDEEGKSTVQHLFALRDEGGEEVGERIVFLEDYNMQLARHLVAGCDVWVNLPRRPMEASGTSGMKAAFNGVLQLSVLDGWWAEGYDGTNGWAIPGDEDPDHDLMDDRDATRFYELLEQEIAPLFSDRDGDGVPHGWCDLVKRSLVTNAPRFSATRMIDEYAERIYPGH
jgi:starch phosphorylase